MSEEPIVTSLPSFPINLIPDAGNPREGYRFLVEFHAPGMNSEEAAMGVGHHLCAIQQVDAMEFPVDHDIVMEPVGEGSGLVESYLLSVSRATYENPEGALPLGLDEDEDDEM